MSGHSIAYEGIFSIRELDTHPIVTTEDGRIWLVSSDSEELLESGIIKPGDEVRIFNRESEKGWPPDQQKKYDARTDEYCTIRCPSCSRPGGYYGLGEFEDGIGELNKILNPLRILTLGDVSVEWEGYFAIHGTDIDKIKHLFQTPKVDSWTDVDDRRIPRDGEEYLTRNDLQGGIFSLIRFNKIHKNFMNKGKYVSESNAGTHWMRIFGLGK